MEQVKIQDYILDKDELQVADPLAPKKKRNSRITYNVVVENGYDVVIERRSTRGVKVAAFIITQNQFYVKDENGDTMIMDEDNLSKFLASASEGIDLPNTYWIKNLQKGKAFAQCLMSFLNYSELVKDNLMTYDMYCSHSSGGRYTPSMIQDLMMLPSRTKKIVKYAIEKDMEIYGLTLEGAFKRMQTQNGYRQAEGFMEEGISNIAWLRFMDLQYGIDNTKKFIDACAERNLSMSLSTDFYCELMSQVDPGLENIMKDYAGNYSRYYAERRREEESAIATYFEEGNFKHNKECFEFDSFLEYVTSYQYEGYRNLRDFVSEWNDTLKNEKEIFGKITEKYPKNLQTTHARSVLKVAEIQKIKELTDFATSYEAAKELEWKTSGYMFIVPETPQEMVDEAINQSNCLRSYISDVAHGYKKIVFLRRAKAPSISYITIEVRNNGTIGQVKGKHNRNVTAAESRIVANWAVEKGLIYSG